MAHNAFRHSRFGLSDYPYHPKLANTPGFLSVGRQISGMDGVGILEEEYRDNVRRRE
jgi:hypothetical protein